MSKLRDRPENWSKASVIAAIHLAWNTSIDNVSTPGTVGEKNFLFQTVS
ncbi:hypothetical protein [Scytonema sp. NUACC26]